MLGDSLGFTQEETARIDEYLRGEGLLKRLGLAGETQITHREVTEVEAALSEPKKPTEHFPAVFNVLNVGNMSGSAIQQGTQHSSQAVSFQQNQVDDVREFLNSLKRDLPQLALAPEQSGDVEADIATVEAQLRSSRPKGTIIKESLHSIRNILERATGSLLASGLLTEIARFTS